MDGEQWLNFRENMRYFRLIQGITGKEMAARMGKSVAWVSQVEAGLYARWPASFQSTPPCGGDALEASANMEVFKFQSTPPCGGDGNAFP